MEKVPLLADARDEQVRRRRFVAWAGGIVLGSQAARSLVGELLTARIQKPDLPVPRTFRDFCMTVFRELRTPIGEPQVEHDQQGTNRPGSVADLPAMIGNGIGRAKDVGVSNIPSDAYDYFSSYGEQGPDLLRQRCNNHAYDTCRAFARYGLPMHLLGIVPPVRHLLAKDWHVMAFCPLHGTGDDARAHLIIDNGRPLLWRHESLEKFVAWYERDSPPDERRWIPPKGIARYREPKHPSAHPLLMHIAHAVSSPTLESLELDALFETDDSMLV